MKKLQDLTPEELKSLYNKNKGFCDLVDRLAYDDQMYSQEEQGRLIGCEAFEIHNYYSSFYLATPCHYGVKEGLSVAGKLNKEYLSEEAARVYGELCAVNSIYENLDADGLEEKGEKLEEKANTLCDKLAEIITEDLRAFETLDDLTIETILTMINDGYMLEDFETDGAAVYEHITKVYK